MMFLVIDTDNSLNFQVKAQSEDDAREKYIDFCKQHKVEYGALSVREIKIDISDLIPEGPDSWE